MKKMSTLYKKDPNDPSKVLIGQIAADNMWVFDEGVLATQKFDGTSCAVINGELYKRYDAKHGKVAPEGAIPCCEPDLITGHHPHWLKCDRSKREDQYHFEAFDAAEGKFEDGTYELVGPKINGNAEHLTNHILVRHGYISADEELTQYLLKDSDRIERYIFFDEMEGLVFHHPDGRMCKIRAKDFGMKRFYSGE